MTATTEYFKSIGKIQFEGKASDNPLAYKYYNPEQIVAGKNKNEQFKFFLGGWGFFFGVVIGRGGGWGREGDSGGAVSI